MVNASLTMFVGSRETAKRYMAGMDALFIHGRLALADAAELIEHFGDAAQFEAAARAERSRDEGNVGSLLPLAADRTGNSDIEQRRNSRDRPLSH